MTLRELKEKVHEAPVDDTMVTPRQLMESGAEIVVQEMFGDAMLTVFISGYVLYERICEGASIATVFRLHSCREYRYGSVMAQGYGYEYGILPEEQFSCENWFLRLLLEGEDRLTSNAYRNYCRNVLFYDAIDVDYTDYLHDSDSNPEVICICREERQMFEELLECMTDRQREIIDLYYLEGMKMEEIAKHYHVSRQYIGKVVRDAIWKARESCGIKKRPIPRGVYNKGRKRDF